MQQNDLPLGDDTANSATITDSTGLTELGNATADLSDPSIGNSLVSQNSTLLPDGNLQDPSLNSTGLTALGLAQANDSNSTNSTNSTGTTALAGARATLSDIDTTASPTNSTTALPTNSKLKYIKPDLNLTNDDSFTNESLVPIYANKSIYTSKYGSDPDLSTLNHAKWVERGGMEGSFNIPNLRTLFSPRAYSTPRNGAVKRSNPFESGFRTRGVKKKQERNLVNTPKKNSEDFFWN